jgi:predicted flap endonuclease-1-like 5' DNA nuclease
MDTNVKTPESLAALFPWRQIPNSGEVKAVTQLRDGTILGVGLGIHFLYTRATVTSPWVQVPNSGDVKGVTQLLDGTILGVGLGDHLLYTRATLTSPWVQVPNSGNVTAVTQLGDGTILAVGTDSMPYSRATLTGTWVRMPDSGALYSLAQLDDGRIVGVGTNGNVYTRLTLTSPWVLIPGSGSVVALTQLSDGTLLGVGGNGQLYLAGEAAPKQEPPKRCVLTFDKTGDVVDMGKRPEHKIPRDMTMEAWIYPTKQLKWGGILSRIFDTNATESGYCLSLDGASGFYAGLRTTTGPAESFYYSSGPNTLPLNEWHHVAATYDGKQIVLYVDGEQKKTVPNTGDVIYNPDNSLTIGAYRDDNENYAFPGKIAEVRLWDVARTQEQLKAAKDVVLRGDEANLVGYWRMDECSGDTVKDRSKNAADGKITGAKWGSETVPFGQKAPEPPKPAPSGDGEKARAELEKKIAALAEQAKKCGECDDKLAALGKQLAERDQKCAAYEQKIDAQDRKLTEQERSNLDQERRLLEQDRKLTEQERSNLDQERKLLAQDKKIAEQDRTNVEQEKKLLAQDKKIAEQEKSNVDQEKKLLEQDGRIAEQDRKIADLAAAAARCGDCDEKLRTQTRTIEQLTTKIEDLEKRLAAVKPVVDPPKPPPPPPPPPPPVKPDNLEAIEGIGPQIAGVLKEAGIRTYKDLAAVSVAALKKILAAGGTKFARNDPTSWPKQAQLLAEGKLAELKKYQDSLTAGRDKA